MGILSSQLQLLVLRFRRERAAMASGEDLQVSWQSLKSGATARNGQSSPGGKLLRASVSIRCWTARSPFLEIGQLAGTRSYGERSNLQAGIIAGHRHGRRRGCMIVAMTRRSKAASYLTSDVKKTPAGPRPVASRTDLPGHLSVDRGGAPTARRMRSFPTR